MIRAALLGLAALMLASAPAAAQAQSQADRLRAVGDRGRLLYELDRAAWVTTDDLRARDPAARSWPTKGWVVESDGPHAFVVTYFGEGDGGLRAFYVGRVKDNKVVSGEVLAADSRPLLTPEQLRLVRARDAAAKSKFRPCTSAPFNTVIIPPRSAGEPIDVYLLSAQTEANVYPFGGHYKVSIGPDGRIRSKRKFTNSCLNMSTEGLPEGAEMAAPMVTHLLDPIPTEIHVFMSLSMGKPVGVGTRNGMWWVEGERIESLAGQ